MRFIAQIIHDNGVGVKAGRDLVQKNLVEMD
jgi:hypothetical protein